jgi:hypothetical protein
MNRIGNVLSNAIKSRESHKEDGESHVLH